MPNYDSLTSNILQQAKFREDTLPLLNEACRSRFFFQPHPTPKVFLFFHGFTAAPYQFVPMGEAFYQAGYNVLIPLLPGHGQAGDWNGDHPPPLPETLQIYQDFARDWLQKAQALGDKVIVGGLSANANLAAWLALEYPEQIDRALLFAPYLSGTNSLVDLVVEFLPVYYEWLNKKSSGHFGYDGFRMPALRIFLDMAQDMMQHIDQYPLVPPMFMIASESDHATNQDDQQSFFEALVKRQPKCWYHCFDKKLKVPHTMMTKIEGNEYQDLLLDMSQAFVESDRTWAELQEQVTLMIQNQTYDEVVAALNLTQPVSPIIVSMMATHLLKNSVAQRMVKVGSNSLTNEV